MTEMDSLKEPEPEHNVSVNELNQKASQSLVNRLKLSLKRYSSLIGNTVRKKVWDRSLHEDVEQDVAIRIARKLSGFDPSDAAKFGGWIYQTTVRVCQEHLRKRRNRSLENTFYANNPGESDDTVANPSGTPEQIAIRNEQKQRLYQKLAELPEKYRTPIILHDIEELSWEEISQITGINIGTLKSQASRGRQLLLKKLTADSSHNRSNSEDKGE
ncbi:MAG: sigma-70 family RNA polymerase sigma factor [Blastocatellia bacterium]